MALYGLTGKSLKHSFSPDFFNTLFEELGLKHSYELFELQDVSEIKNLTEKYPQLKGFNVTIPFKRDILYHLDYVSEEAKSVGAVNTVVIKREPAKILLSGYNTDIFGFEKSLMQISPGSKNALILGTGGASQAVKHVLAKYNYRYTLVSRNPVPGYSIGYKDLTDTPAGIYNVIINTTPVGMFPVSDVMPPIPETLFGPGIAVIDLIYNPEKTLLLAKAEQSGCRIVNGMTMLHQQALKSWEIWKSQID